MPVMAKYSHSKQMRKISFHLGNFPPKSKAILTCHMSGRLDSEEGNHVFRLPLTYVPQYVIDKASPQLPKAESGRPDQYCVDAQVDSQQIKESNTVSLS